MHFINFNGKILEATTAIIGADNRGLRYGDGLFETLKCVNNQLIFTDEHFSRLWKGLQMLKFDIPKLFTPHMLEEQVIQLISKNKLTAARVRITVTRGNGGIYDPLNHHPHYIIQCWPLPQSALQFNENGLQLCLYSGAKKMADSFANLKHNNYLPYFMGALYAKEQHCNDAVILNNHDRTCDSTIANIFIIKNNTVYTPSLEEGCIAGVMRKFIIQNLPVNKFSVFEKSITIDELLDADEVFLSNSIYNIRWVSGIGNTRFADKVTREIFNTLTKTNPDIFC